MLKWKSILCTGSKEVNVHGWEVREGLTEVLRERRVGKAPLMKENVLDMQLQKDSRADHRVFCGSSRARIYISVPGTKSRGSFHLYFQK